MTRELEMRFGKCLGQNQMGIKNYEYTSDEKGTLL